MKTMPAPSLPHRRGERLWVYETYPIDSWFGWTAVVKAIASEFGDAGQSPQEVLWRLYHGQRIARKLGWEGDIRKGNGPYLTALPLGDTTVGEYLIAWKQDNNGQSFVVSPIRLDYLEQAADEFTEKNWVEEKVPFGPYETSIVWGEREQDVKGI